MADTAAPSKRLVNLIEVSPKTELVFNYVVKKTLTSFIQVKNISNGVLAFKVKTNVPQSYLVKPHEGVLMQDKSQEIEITMQPTDYNPQTSTLNDKFLVVAMLLPPNFNPSQVPNLWKSTPTDEQHQIKLKVLLKADPAQQMTESRSSAPTKTPSLTAISQQPLRASLDSASTAPIKEQTTVLSTSTPISIPTPAERVSFDMGENGNSQVFHSISFKNNREERTSLSIETEKPVVKLQETVKQSEPFEPAKKNSTNVEHRDNIPNERLIALEKELSEMKAERDRYKVELDQSNHKRKSQEQFVFQLSEDKNKIENELNMLKTSTLKRGKELGGATALETAKPIELWHTIIIAIIAMILGAFLSRG